MTDKKELVIVIPGAKFIRHNTKFTQKLILFFYSITHVFKPVYSNYAKTWADKFNAPNRKVIWLHWSRGLTTISMWLAVKRLHRIIKQYRNYDIKLVGISLGGEIILRTLRVEKYKDSITKAILVCPTNELDFVLSNNTPIINIYSEHDFFAKIAVKILSPFFGGIKLKGDNVTNIEIPEFSHDKFCNDDKIESGEYAGKRITDIVNSYLKDLKN